MNLERLRLRTLRALDPTNSSDRIGMLVAGAITLLVLLNVVAVGLESIDPIYAAHGPMFQAFETFSIAVFSIEYLLRLWAAGARYSRHRGGRWRGRKEQFWSVSGWIDLLAVLPYYLNAFFPGADLRVLRLLRLIRVFKLSHYSTAIEDLFQAIYEERRAFVATLYLLLIAVLLTSSLMYYAEHRVQPEVFSSIPATIYWSVITLTTVGYGDVSPVTWIGQVIAMATSFMGVCTVALLTGIVASAFANQMARRRIIYEAQLRESLRDGHLDQAEQDTLMRLQRSFNLSQEQAASILEQVKRESDRA